MTHALRGVLLLAMAGLIVRLLVSGQMALYMSPGLDPLSWATAVVLAAMAVVELRAAGQRRALGSHTDDLLTYVPIAALLGVGALVSPHPLDASALGGVGAARAVVAFSATPAAGSVVPPSAPIADLPDLFRYLRVAGESAAGLPVRVVGMAVPDATLGPNQFVLLRYTIVHCVADAQPLGLLIDAPGPAPVSGGWVAIDGVLAVSALDKSHLVSVRATQVALIDQPSEPYVWNL